MFGTRDLIASALLVASVSYGQIDRIAVTATDTAAAREATSKNSHAPRAHGSDKAVAARSAPASATNADKRFPGDLSFGGGAVVVSAQSHAIYMNPNGACTIASCWGDPEGFLRDLGASDFIRVVDQYVKNNVPNRYTVGSSAMINYVPHGSMTMNDALAQIHAVAASKGQSGYGHVYHLFLPPGQSVCQSAGVCYSPDQPSSDVLCAWHGSADFFDIGHVLYTIEPWQLGGCGVAPGSPNGTLADSTNNVLSHELFETITDPDFTAWFVNGTLDLNGEEIGDECAFFIPGAFDVPVFKIGSKVVNGMPYPALLLRA